MRKLSPAVLLWSALLMAEAPALAQITLVPGQSFLVPRRPTYITSADFNGDNLADAAVLNVGSNKVTVLFGSPGGTFGTISDYDVARGLQHLAAGDVNGDGRPDLAVVTSLEGGMIFGLISEPNSTFRKATQLAGVAGRRPVYVVVADIDRANGNDMVTADRTSDTVSVILNRGGNLGFAPSFTKQAGGRPIGVAIADVDLDGNRDILSLNVKAPGADSVAILRATGTGDFRAPVPFTVGEGARAMAVIDLNRDGAPDVLVLNAATTAGANTFTVSVLLNNRPRPGSADPIFSTLTPVRVNCPTTIGGIPIACSATSLVADDFDQDGFADFVVSAQTAALSGQAYTAGLLLAYAGNGDGSFTFANQASVGVRPRDMAVGDFNGDLVPDIAVAEEGDRSVRVVLSLPPVKREVGLPCNLPTQCESGNCVDGRCCGTASCPAGQFCNIPGREGTCAPALDNGLACTTDSQCRSGFCVDGFCCGSRSCPAGQFCNSGTCTGPAPTGTRCGTGDQCASGFCVDGVCCATERCAFGERCDAPGSPGVCTGTLPIGSACTSPAHCASGFCVDGACCRVSSCPAGQSCGVPGSAGACVALPTATATPPPTATPTATPTPQPLGAACSSGAQCVSGACVDGVCCASASCPAGQSCNVFGSAGACTPLRGDGQECRTDSDCATGNCQPGTPPVCAPPRTPTPTRTATPTATVTPLPNGLFCFRDADCQSGFCTDGFCCASRACPPGQRCDVEGREGQCSNPKPTGGQTCDPNETNPCAGGLFCNADAVCCQTASCPAGQRCDITGREGRCSAPSSAGAECSKNTDCQSGLECRLDPATERLRCLPPRTPTPTLIPAPTSTAVGGRMITSTRGGGCSITEDRDGRSAWLLVLLPLALGLRRHALAVARRRRAPGRSE